MSANMPMDGSGFAELEAEGWTDLHIHPVDSHWMIKLDELSELLLKMGVKDIGLLTLHQVEDCWDDGGAVPPPLLEQEGVSIDDLPALLQHRDLRHLSAIIDPAQTGLLPLMAHCQSKEWHGCLLSIGWGLTTVPDPDCTRTAARFHLSMAIGGPGVPEKYKQFAKSTPQSEAVRDAMRAFGALIGAPCTATVTFGE